MTEEDKKVTQIEDVKISAETEAVDEEIKNLEKVKALVEEKIHA